MGFDSGLCVMTIAEAALLLGKSEKTIRRWKRSGVNVLNEATLHEYSDVMDARARGRTATPVFDRPGTTEPRRIIRNCKVRSYFPSNPDPDAFYDLPFPERFERAEQALAILEELKASFEQRVKELKPIGHKESIWLAENDLVTITESARLLAMLLEAFVS